MISIVCVNNNDKILNNYLLKSLENQTLDYELIIVDNTKGTFKSAAEALNYGGRKAKRKYIMFVHNDVSLSSNKWLEETEKMLDSLSNLGIAGVAGKKNHDGVMTNVTHGDPPKLAGKISIQSPIKVQTLDECLIIIPKCVFEVLQFDEKVCDNWHLYAVDYCLSVKILGFDAYVIPKGIYHRSSGYSMSEIYYVTLKKVSNKHNKSYKNVYTTMGDWNTSNPLILQRIWKKLKCIPKYLSAKLIAERC
ncbi:family 2 glycosyl transferase [Methanosarcina sp. 1.H.T.1A.1]|uniref:glycosyltransferase n=1 Tax=Methanosarcina sp. 1.H.T.1A.1 TaxID=1483602 RepID=UPI000621E327|nr:glycosyltransferase [Methanosarcina sp. 1.H.T.1A.1]KKI00364.1 family 2 glycosyl transferase [Methanosarcina sp. 1.H.T.1A.1]